MNTSSTRLADLERGRALQSEARAALGPLNDDLSVFGGHEAVVLFAVDEESLTAAAVATVETNAVIDEVRHEFRRTNIDDHISDMAVTALGSAVRELKANPFYDSWVEQSHLKPKHMTWTPRPIVDNGQAVATIELAFDVDHGNVPDASQLKRMVDPHRSAIEAAVHALRQFEKETDALRRSLEIKKSVTPNSGILRWDLEGSTELMLSPLEPIAAHYLRDLKVGIKGSIGEGLRAIIDGGDGQNIILDIPKHIDWTDPEAIKRFERGYLEQILEKIRQFHAGLSDQYPELKSPALLLSAATGYVEPNQPDYIEDSVLWRVADNLKQK